MKQLLLLLPFLSGCVVDRPVLYDKTTTTTTKEGVTTTSVQERHLRRTTGALWPAAQDATKLRAAAGKTLSAGTSDISQESVGGTNGVAALQALDSILSKVRP